MKEQEKEWVETAIDRGFTRLQMKRKLQESRYPTPRIDEFLAYYDNIMESIQLEKRKMEVVSEEEKKEEKKFEGDVQKFFTEGKKDLSWKEKRDVKRFLKNVKKYSKMMKAAQNGFKREMEYIGKQNWDKGKIEKELDYLKQEIIDSLINTKEHMDIIHPDTKEEITKKNLQSVNIDVLLEMIDDNVEELDLIVNGKITD